jgi:anthranilate synthase component 2
MSKILILDNYDSFTFNLKHYLEAIQNEEVDVFRNDEITISEIENYDRLVFSPGPGLPADAGILLEVIKTFSAHKSLLGVCLGHQAITLALGGKLCQLNEVVHGKTRSCNVIDPTSKLFKNIPSQFETGRYHSWVADENCFPSELKITAVDDANSIMALEHIYLPIFGVQFHPESIMTKHGHQLLRNWLEV